MYKLFLRPLFFLIDPEKIHHITFRLIKISSRIPLVRFFRRKSHCLNDPKLVQSVFGLDFKNPVGLAAGFDKNAVLYNELSDFGFGFIEIGTVTPEPQEGNPKKRLFRLRADNSLINRMGFNNGGVNKAVEKLKNRKNTSLIIGGNIGKNTGTLPENVIKDYVINFETLFDHVDYFVVNVSCPNVGSMAKLQDKDFQIELLDKLQSINKSKIKRKPILLKIAPDLNNQQLDEVIEIISETKIDGVIASNTSVNREGLKTPSSELEKIGNGGLSGQAVKDRSTKVIKYLSDKSDKQFPIIGVGGIHSPNDAIEKIEAGASLVQIYTGFIYEGPKLVKRINKAIIKNNVKL